jgi:hypothetical protein
VVANAVVRRAILVVAALLSASPARALIEFEGSSGWNLGLEGQTGCLKQTFSNSGNSATCGAVTPIPCDGSGTNYICWDYFGQTELVGGARALMRARSRLVVKNYTSQFQSGKLVYGGARVTFYQVAYAVGSTPGKYAYFNFALHGVRTESTNNAGVTLTSRGTAFLSADKQHFLQCFADVCAPIKVEISPSNWDPGRPDGTVFLVDLRADTGLGIPAGVAVDADVFADYASTLELLSIEIKDENDQTVPGSQLVVNDAQGQPMLTFANTPPTTTTTLPGGTVTTTLPGGTVTTTTLPAVCPTGATFESIDCRLANLVQAVQDAADGSVESKLAGKLSSAQQSVAAAEQALGTSRKQSAKKIGKALNALGAYKNVLKTRAAKKALTNDIRSSLAAPLASLKADLKALKK